MKSKIMLTTSANELPADHQFNGLDLMKFIGAIMVCIIHIRVFNQATITGSLVDFYLRNCICRLAVPFYFTTTGFFLFRKMDLKQIDEERIKEHSFKILRMLGIWSIVLFVGETDHLWYLGAIVIAVVVLGFLLKKGVSLPCSCLLSVLLYTVGMLGTAYYGYLESVKNVVIGEIVSYYVLFFDTTRNGIFFGFIFVLMGAVFAHKKIKIDNRVAVACFGFSVMIAQIEVNWLQKYGHPIIYDMFVSLLPATFFLFYIMSHINLKNRPIYRSLRVIGLLFFFTHWFVYYFVHLAIDQYRSALGIYFETVRFVLTVVFSLLLAILIERLSQREKFKWLKYLYS